MINVTRLFVQIVSPSRTLFSKRELSTKNVPHAKARLTIAICNQFPPQETNSTPRHTNKAQGESPLAFFNLSSAEKAGVGALSVKAFTYDIHTTFGRSCYAQCPLSKW